MIHHKKTDWLFYRSKYKRYANKYTICNMQQTTVERTRISSNSQSKISGRTYPTAGACWVPADSKSAISCFIRLISALWFSWLAETKTSQYSNGSDREHGRHHTDGSSVFTRWWQSASHLIHGSSSPRKSTLFKWHLASVHLFSQDSPMCQRHIQRQTTPLWLQQQATYMLCMWHNPVQNSKDAMYTSTSDHYAIMNTQS